MTRIKEVKRRKALKKEIIESIKIALVINGFFISMFLYYIYFGY